MIICLCSRISDRDVHQAVGNGARRCADVFRAKGCAPQCGSCVPAIRALVEAGAGPREQTPLMAAE